MDGMFKNTEKPLTGNRPTEMQKEAIASAKAEKEMRAKMRAMKEGAAITTLKYTGSDLGAVLRMHKKVINELVIEGKKMEGRVKNLEDAVLALAEERGAKEPSPAKKKGRPPKFDKHAEKGVDNGGQLRSAEPEKPKRIKGYRTAV